MNKNLPLWLSVILLFVFTILYISSGNYEFLAYVASIIIVIILIFKTDKLYNYTQIAKWGFAIWMFLHMSGGKFYFNGTRLYDLILLNLFDDPLNILRYDQVVHAFCYFVITLFIYSIVKYITKEKVLSKTSVFIIFLSGIGIGAINEIIEFSTVVFLNSTGVGDYYNNSLDLIFNSIGAIIALIYLKLSEK